MSNNLLPLQRMIPIIPSYEKSKHPKNYNSIQSIAKETLRVEFTNYFVPSVHLKVIHT